MTELQMGLIGLGAAAVAGVLGYNKWQEYRHRKVAESLLKPHPEDALLGDRPRVAPKMAPEQAAEPAREPAQMRSEPEIRLDEPVVPAGRVEPVLAEAPVFVDPYPTQPGEMPEEAMLEALPVDETEPEALPEMPASPSLADAAPAFAAPAEEIPEVPAGNVPEALLDPRLEYIVTLELVEPAMVAQVMHSQREALARLHKPVHWIGFNERTREWERLSPESEAMVRRLRVGLQLVNRLGPVPEADVAIFTNAMRALADELMAVADMPSSRILDQAAEIDRFCAEVDLEIGLNLVSRGSAFSGTKVRALAESAGMVLGLDGLFTRYDDEGRAQFSLQNFETMPFAADTIRTMSTHGLTFLLDVPRVDHGERVFMQMTELAKRFADALNGALVDDNRQPLSESQLEHIRREFIGKPQASMAAFGLPAGSAQARRLFS